MTKKNWTYKKPDLKSPYGSYKETEIRPTTGTKPARAYLEKKNPSKYVPLKSQSLTLKMRGKKSKKAAESYLKGESEKVKLATGKGKFRPVKTPKPPKTSAVVRGKPSYFSGKVKGVIDTERARYASPPGKTGITGTESAKGYLKSKAADAVGRFRKPKAMKHAIKTVLPKVARAASKAAGPAGAAAELGTAFLGFQRARREKEKAELGTKMIKSAMRQEKVKRHVGGWGREKIWRGDRIKVIGEGPKKKKK